MLMVTAVTTVAGPLFRRDPTDGLVAGRTLLTLGKEEGT